MTTSIRKTPVHIMICDDAFVQRRVLQRAVEDMDFVAITVNDGQGALAEVERSLPDCLLLDLELPGMHGTEVLRRLREKYESSALPIIIISSNNQEQVIADCLDNGANDYLSKPVRLPLLGARIRAQLRVKELCERIERRNKELEHAQTDMLKNFEAAVRIQRSLLPDQIPKIPGLRFDWKYQPCSELGGDVLNVLPINDQYMAIYMIDVSGHGVQAALLAVTLSHLLLPQQGGSLLVEHMHGESLPADPLDVARQLNDRFQISRQNLQYFTMWYGVLDVETRTLRYVQAGSTSPILLRNTTQRAEILEGSGTPIGLMPDADYVSVDLKLEPGDRLLLYSDCLNECTDVRGQQFGLERLRRSVEQAAQLPTENLPERLWYLITDWTEKDVQDDDFSVLLVSADK